MSMPRIKLESPLRRRKLLTWLAYCCGLLLLVASVLDHVGGATSTDDWTRFDHQTFLVSRVVDGDTIHIRPVSGGDETVIRLLGIDAPEMHDPQTGHPAHWAERATQYVRARAEGKTVSIQIEPIQTRDRYHRLLAYVWLADNDCLNLDLIHDGQAYADRRFRHSYRPQYEQAESEARRKQRGLWKDLTEAQMPPWRRVWLHSRDEETRAAADGFVPTHPGRAAR
jgi:micrococcal nuclease